ncbi:unnamed protein product [Cylicostephanus goldi]|uniref:Eukaryotic translation initiation factor 3 subunit C N-terminal domain-containing protein n=1 Tax=Cylicostephanus goldi TaxID=71465 RepID=A0A3P6RNB2_CYLGO|nr:unnamed protein product [Cylicostephanus goldi]
MSGKLDIWTNARDFAYPSDSEDEEKRVVRTHKEKKFKELKDFIKQVNNAKNNKDFTKILSAFDELVKIYEKSRTVFARQNISTPRFYVRYLVDLEDFVLGFWDNKEAKSVSFKACISSFYVCSFFLLLA